MISYYENGQSIPDMLLLVKISDLFNVSLQDVVLTDLVNGSSSSQEELPLQSREFYERIISSKEAENEALKKQITLLEALLKTKQ